LAVRTQELENAIWVYRDMMFLGKFPMDIYAVPLQWALITVVPIGMMISYPAQALLGVLTPVKAAYALVFAAALLTLSLRAWSGALRQYTSVSS
jgi:ABC-2 type transport system permease protein